jgi:hypothetical protein
VIIQPAAVAGDLDVIDRHEQADGMPPHDGEESDVKPIQHHAGDSPQGVPAAVRHAD